MPNTLIRLFLAAIAASANLAWIPTSTSVSSERVFKDSTSFLGAGSSSRALLPLERQNRGRAELRVHLKEFLKGDDDEEDEQDVICAPSCSITCSAVACIRKGKSGRGNLLPVVQNSREFIPGFEVVRRQQRGGYSFASRLRGGSSADSRKPTVDRRFEKSFQEGEPTIWAAARVGDVEVGSILKEKFLLCVG
jgi:hypothetical protein